MPARTHKHIQMSLYCWDVYYHNYIYLLFPFFGFFCHILIENKKKKTIHGMAWHSFIQLIYIIIIYMNMVIIITILSDIELIMRQKAKLKSVVRVHQVVFLIQRTK